MAGVTRDETAGILIPAVSMRGITKRFPGVVANDSVDFEVRAGEVHALLGENGAGKSTLSNILAGIYRPDEGQLFLNGKLVELNSPRSAIEHGIGMVHQHFRLVQTFSVAENVALGLPGRFSKREAEDRVAALGERFGLPVDPRALIWQLSVGEQQRVEILKSLEREARVLILDEPTAVLTPPEAEVLFETLRTMAAEGRSVIFISHKLDEVMAVSDRVTVLRDATDVGVVEVSETTPRELARLMVGRDVVFNAEDTLNRATVDWERVVLQTVDLRANDDRGNPALNGVSLELHAGEILGVCGVSGNGQRELAEAICASRGRTGGQVLVDGETTIGKDPREMIRRRVSHIPEDRLHTGLAASVSIEDNLVLKAYRAHPFSLGPLLRRRSIRSHATQLVEQFGVKAPGTSTSTRLLSGGNVQKVLLAREFSSDPVAVVAASPTRGLDVGSIETVRHLLLEAARRGVGVLLITEDLEEALALSDRILVMYEGRVAGEVSRDEADLTELGLLMGGRSAVGSGAQQTGGSES